MGKIIDSKTAPVTVHTDQGDQQVEQVREVTFIDALGSVHTLIFEPAGTNVAGAAEEDVRTVGDQVPHFAYTDPAEAVKAYEEGVIA